MDVGKGPEERTVELARAVVPVPRVEYRAALLIDDLVDAVLRQCRDQAIEIPTILRDRVRLPEIANLVVELSADRPTKLLPNVLRFRHVNLPETGPGPRPGVVTPGIVGEGAWIVQREIAEIEI